MNISLAEVATEQGITQVTRLASHIWNEYYPAIIGRPQVDYMLDRYQSQDAIRRQILEGYRYFIIRVGEADAGYSAVVGQSDLRTLQLSKLYLLSPFRNRGVAKTVVKWIADFARDGGYERLYLTVNKYNHASIAAYEKLGFARCGEMVADIGNGFVMDDYEMERSLIAAS